MRRLNYVVCKCATVNFLLQSTLAARGLKEKKLVYDQPASVAQYDAHLTADRGVTSFWAQAGLNNFKIDHEIILRPSFTDSNNAYLISCIYCKVPKYSDAWNLSLIILKFEQCGSTIESGIQKCSWNDITV